MASLNRVFLAGNLTRDPEARRLPSGNVVCTLGLAINRRYRNGSTGELVEETTFVNVDVWGNQAAFCRDYLRKGSPVLVEGRLRLDTWEDRNTGAKRSRLMVVADRVQSLASRSDNAAGGENGDFRPTYSQSASQQQQVPPFPNGGRQGSDDTIPPPSDDVFDPDADSIDDIPF
ncbi:MAG: single-stranded DNA-binding protein [Lentisphaerae bacterium]|nr:MAG: single-stranded DNA-binding protein [Lentisphaerota bacterium]